MKNKLLAVAAVFTVLFAFASCGVIKSKVPNKPSTTASSTANTKSSKKNTDEESTQEDAGDIITETETSTTSNTSASSVSSVASSVITTVKKTANSTTYNYTGTTTKSSKTTITDLKYGVDLITTTTTIYGYKADGSKFVVGTEVTNRYDRSTYSASYSELLPAARVNRQNYSSYINEVLRLTNQMRAEQGIAPLTLNSNLTEQACVRAEEVAWAGPRAHGHTRPNTRSYTSIFTDNGYTTGLVGENVGWYYTTPAAVCQAWKNSQTHYENIMNPEFKSIGIGIAPEADPTLGLVWVQHFYSN